jgi:hypothetical protein
MGRAKSDYFYCEFPDGSIGAIPVWMTDAAACAQVRVGEPMVGLTALLELRKFLDTVHKGMS